MRDCKTGRGVFAVNAISSGTMIMRYTGAFLRQAQTTPQTLALQIGPDLYLGESGNADDFVNHSCDPNAGMKIIGTDVRLHAIRDIRPMSKSHLIIQPRWMKTTSNSNVYAGQNLVAD